MSETNKNKKIFKALGCNTRLNILKLLADNEMHITGIANELGISVPVTAKHIRILENAELVERQKFGNSHILKVNTENIYTILDKFAPTKDIEVERGTNLLDILKKVSSVEVKKIGDREAVVSTDGDEGFFVYEVNGKMSDKTVHECTFEDDAIVEWKKLEPITRLKLDINIKDHEDNS
ncbi:transcriptional regulator, ArsR family [Methanohalobium evestigatum Z-7303]|jgi:DNA-binding transcriptional ArsR family regulator|uniref:Transcriptional regulator, ArsR family n=1 Tax=Methanohalobium evestigatum (strain ATCC BAA-1072 / DSM 3721 / NBRC 107634 / OCM 161 / Z-7303) TaxID=644295 RepID=D7EA52_METEZ|nr:metalloregulator ArsR/SmtB family transcription factor [Methanohalobium evestigatum]ADI74723.1 transcriptional regulator, ArsR family [Methanohalobium evestigatum Z-7303]